MILPAEVPMDNGTRKDDHIRICLDGDVETARAGNGLDAFEFDHAALPDLDFSDVNPSTSILGHDLRWPFIVGSMTGGSDRAGGLNMRLAEAASRSGCGMALGSLRPAMEDDALTSTFDVRGRVDDLPLLIGNIGVAQLTQPGLIDRLLHLCEGLRLDGLYVHLNPLQEVLQPGGDTDFKGLLDRLVDLRSKLRRTLDIPLAVKEVGSGLSRQTVEQLVRVGPDLVETSGKGGTSWIKVEGMRAEDPVRQRCAQTLAGWGHTMVESIGHIRELMPGAEIVASGGLRTGLDLALAIRIGADAGAMALPLLRAAEEGPERLDELLDTVLFELSAVMFGTGSRTLKDLRGAPVRTTTAPDYRP